MRNNNKIEVLFEDEYYIGINKPAGILSIPDRWDKTLPNLKAILRKPDREIFPVHRLDKDTSGSMIFAKTPEAHKVLNGMFDSKEINKVYHAVLKGILFKDELDVDIPIMSDPRKKGRMIPSARGKAALTKIKVLERFRSSTLVECVILTGRQHQIRVHCSTIGNPLLVDSIYGESSEFLVSSVKKRFNIKKGQDEIPIISRHTLHSSMLSFIHPFTNEMVTLESEYPKDLRALLQVLRKYSSASI